LTQSLLDVPLGSQTPALELLPADRVRNAADDVIDLAASAGLDLFPWQRRVLQGAMWVTDERTNDGALRHSAREVACLVGRQNGKGSVLEARQLGGLFLLNERLQIHTAHEFKTCYEHFRRVVDLIESAPHLRAQLKPRTGIRTGAGDQAIELKNGNRIRFLARSRSSGRGFSADVIYLDEAFLLDEATMGALLPTLSARPNPQIWYTSSAAHHDSVVLHRLTQRAQAGDDQRLFYIEWRADEDADPRDPAQWLKANPSVGYRISLDDIDAEQRSLAPEEFARERLGIAEAPDGGQSALAVEQWLELTDTGSSVASALAIGLDVSPDRKWSTFGCAGRRFDELFHVETIDRRPGTGWVVARAVDLVERHRVPIIIDPASPAGALKSQLVEAGVDLVEIGVRDLVNACGMFEDAVMSRTLRHIGQRSLHEAIVGASRRRIGDSWAWNRLSSQVDITPLVACTLALGAVPNAQPDFFAY
jgi:hypothetical protein